MIFERILYRHHHHNSTLILRGMFDGAFPNILPSRSSSSFILMYVKDWNMNKMVCRNLQKNKNNNDGESQYLRWHFDIMLKISIHRCTRSRKKSFPTYNLKRYKNEFTKSVHYGYQWGKGFKCSLRNSNCKGNLPLLYLVKFCMGLRNELNHFPPPEKNM
jgi:hypothetical protein